MRKFMQSHTVTVIGTVLGALGGYLYYSFEGCASGSCAITSSPLYSTLYGALAGSILFSMFNPSAKND